jgi:hypothetical protein
MFDVIVDHMFTTLATATPNTSPPDAPAFVRMSLAEREALSCHDFFKRGAHFNRLLLYIKFLSAIFVKLFF